jgi:site-specific DNA recombinase
LKTQAPQLRCATYARYSTDRQNPLSTQDQLEKCRQFSQHKDWEFLEACVYTDAEISGATLDRPGLRELLASAESTPRPFDVVLVEDASRLSRKQADVLNLCERLKFAGLRICFVSQGIDSSDKTFQLLLLTRCLIDQLFLDDTAKRVRRGMEGLIRRGLHTGGRCFGYRGRKEADGVRLEVDEPEAVIVRRIFQKYADGFSLKQLAKALNPERIVSPRPPRGGLERSWSPVAIRHILKNERYGGKVVWNKKHKVHNPRTGRRVFRPLDGESPIHGADAPHLRIVSDDLWSNVQARFAEIRNRCIFKKRPGLIADWQVYGSRYLFSGLLKCGLCGGNITLVSGAGKHSHAKYGCPMHHSRGTCSNAVTIRTEILEAQLIEGLQSAVLRPEVVEYTLEQFQTQLKLKLDQIAGDLEGLRKRKRELEAEVERLTSALALGDTARPPVAIVAAITSKEREIDAIHEKLLGPGLESFEARVRSIRQFAMSRLTDVRRLLHEDVPTAKAELRRHVESIELTPQENEEGVKILVASGEWNLLGGYQGPRNSDGAGGQS